MNEVKNTTDENKIKEDYKRLAQIYIEDMPYFSLFTSKYTIAYNSALAGEINSNWYNLFYNIESWYK